MNEKDEGTESSDTDSGSLDHFPITNILPAPSMCRENLTGILNGTITAATSPLQEVDQDFDNLSETYKQHYEYMVLRSLVETWSSAWGGVGNWSDSLSILFSQASDAPPGNHRFQAALNVVLRVYCKSEDGKRLLSCLDNLQGCLPVEQLAVVLLWRFHNDLVKTLVKAITLLDCRLTNIYCDLLGTGISNYKDLLDTLNNCS